MIAKAPLCGHPSKILYRLQRRPTWADQQSEAIAMHPDLEVVAIDGDGAALMRVVAALDMDACNADLRLGGELAANGTRSRIVLRSAGQAALRAEFRHESDAAPLRETLQPAAVRWRHSAASPRCAPAW